MSGVRAEDVPASSMALWTGLVESALRSDYPEPRAEPSSGDPLSPAHTRVSRRRTWPAVAVVVGLITFIIITAALAVLRDRPVQDAQRVELAERVVTQEAEVQGLEKSVATLEDDVDALTRDILATDAQGTSLVEKIRALEAQAGLTSVTGAGVTVLLDDAEDGGELGLVMDRDLQATVNALWQAGASAVAVNGIRLTSTTAIRAAGEAILVGYRPLAPPYTVDAIGADPSAFARTEGGRTLDTLADQFGIRVDITAGERSVPASAAP